MISKVYGDTVWIMAGRSERREKFFDKAWLRAVHFPYYAGHGFALSLGKWSVRIGICTPLYNAVNLEDEGDVVVYSTMANELDIEAEEIREWGFEDEEIRESDSDDLDLSEPKTELVG